MKRFKFELDENEYSHRKEMRTKVMNLVSKLQTESSFKLRIAIMDEVKSNLDYLSNSQLQQLDSMIEKDEYGYFNKTWDTVSFALAVKAKISEKTNSPPSGKVKNLPVLRIKQTKQIIASGASGNILCVEVERNSQVFCAAVKFLNIVLFSSAKQSSSTLTYSEEVDYSEELVNISMLCNNPKTSPYCVNIYGITVSSDMRIGIVMKKYYSDLDEFILSNNITEQQMLNTFKRCVECIHLLHNHGTYGIIHNDIKAKNFLLGPKENKQSLDQKIQSIVVTDFGFSKERARTTLNHFSQSYASIGGIAGSYRGTLAYSAPELKEGYHDNSKVLFTKRTDIYSLGVLLGFIMTKTHPYPKMNEFQIIFEPMKEPYDKSLFKKVKSKLLITAYDWCTMKNREDRPGSCESLLELLKLDLVSTEEIIQEKKAELMEKQLKLPVTDNMSSCISSPQQK